MRLFLIQYYSISVRLYFVIAFSNKDHLRARYLNDDGGRNTEIFDKSVIADAVIQSSGKKSNVKKTKLIIV